MSSPETFADHFSFLLVDDHDFMQRLIAETLNSAGAGNIDRASSGQEAIKVLNKIRKVDFVITDFNMPGMNGLELLKAVRVGDTDVDRDTPVIMLSGFDDEPLLHAAMELDASGYIQKPVSKVELVTRMNKIFMSEAKIKDVEAYRDVELPEIDGVFQETSPSPNKDIASEVARGGVSVPLDKVPEGSLIVEEVVTTSGVSLVRSGERASAQLIEFLQQTQKITGITILVVRPS